MNDNFNIFDVLSKDNKELIHSAFLAFLFKEEGHWFVKRLLRVAIDDKWKVRTEEKFGKRQRIDIILDSSKHVIIIENKFKSLPNRKQLEGYSEILEKKYPQKDFSKFLIYFARKADFELPEGWQALTYADVVAAIQEYMVWKKDLEDEKAMFLRHYVESVNSYIQKYQSLKDNPKEFYALFDHSNNNPNRKFWIQLMFHELKGYLKKRYQLDSKVNAGGVYFPSIDVYEPEAKWKRGDYGFFIQLDSHKLKYYAYFEKNGKVDRQSVVDAEKEKLQSSGFVVSKSGKYKNKLSNNKNSGFIYQEDMLQELPKEKFTIEEIATYINDFRNKISKVVANE